MSPHALCAGDEFRGTATVPRIGAVLARVVAATTTGVGEQVLDAVRHGARRVVVGCGGSATTDGGSGMVRAVLDAGGLPPTCRPPA